MKIPNEIKTLAELAYWCVNNNPDSIEVSKDSELIKISHFRIEDGWKLFRGIPIIYEKN